MDKFTVLPLPRRGWPGSSFLLVFKINLGQFSNTSAFCEFCVIFKSSCSYRTSPVAASVYFLLDELYLSLQPIHVINYLFNNVIWICYSVFFYSIAFIANTFHLGFHLVSEFLFFLYFFGCCECWLPRIRLSSHYGKHWQLLAKFWPWGAPCIRL